MVTYDQEEPGDQAVERPISVEKQKTIESQQAQTEIKDDSTTTPAEMVDEFLGGQKEGEKIKPKQKSKPKTDETFRKLFDQFAKHFQVSRVASDKTTNMLKQIQKQLSQID